METDSLPGIWTPVALTLDRQVCLIDARWRDGFLFVGILVVCRDIEAGSYPFFENGESPILTLELPSLPRNTYLAYHDQREIAFEFTHLESIGD